MQYYEALAELGTGISIPLLLQTDKDPSQLKTQLPKAGEEVDADVLTGSDSSRKRLVNNNYYYHFHWAVRKTATIWAHAAIAPGISCSTPKVASFVKTQVSIVIQRIALFRNYDYGNGRPTVFVFNSAALQLSSQSSF